MDYEKKYKEALERARAYFKNENYTEMADVFPELAESEDERIRKALIEVFKEKLERGFEWVEYGIPNRSVLSWLEKQKVEHPKEQNQNIELIQKSWYMEGYYDCEFGYEPKWIIKTGEGGPRYEENPKYGQIIEQKPAEWVLPEDFEEAVYKVANFISPFDNQEELRKASHRFAEQLLSLAKKELDKPTEKQDYSGLNDFERAIHRGFLCAGVVNVPVNIIKETAQDCLAHLPAEWSLEDDHIIGFVYDLLNEIEWKDDWAMSKEECLRLLSNYSPQKPTKWSDEDETRLKVITEELERFIMFNQYGTPLSVDDIDWLKNLPERFSLQPKQEWNEEDKDIINEVASILINDENRADNKKEEDRLAYLAEKIQSLHPMPKVELSEEDERMLQDLCEELQDLKRGNYRCYTKDVYDEWIAWLKYLPLSLKKRNEDVDKLCSNEWSEEDERNRDRAIFYTRFYQRNEGTTKGSEECIDWLKSPRPVSKESLQPHWKPSEYEESKNNK